MLDAMASTKNKKPGKKPAAEKPAKERQRQKSRLTEIGDAAMQKALLDTCVAQSWQLNKVAEVLGLGGSANVIRALRALDLLEPYEAARARGDIKRGARSGS